MVGAIVPLNAAEAQEPPCQMVVEVPPPPDHAVVVVPPSPSTSASTPTTYCPTPDVEDEVWALQTAQDIFDALTALAPSPPCSPPSGEPRRQPCACCWGVLCAGRAL